jgi:hypothetical protein
MVRVIIHPAKAWLSVLLQIAGLTGLTIASYLNWTRMDYPLRAAFIVALIVGLAGLISRLLVTEVIEINAIKITIRKHIRSWERLREYEVKHCRELEWTNGSEDEDQSMQFKTGRNIITFGAGITEEQSLQIFKVLQETLPDVAEQLCTYPQKQEYFIKRGLS